ncbi:MAG: hypothetical protein WCJ56_02085 [bacterium]
MLWRDRFTTATYWAKQWLMQRDALAYYHTLMLQQHASVDEIAEINWLKRKLLLQHSYDTVPFYHSRLTSIGLHPNDIVTPDDWSKIPLLTKDDLRHNLQELVSTTVSAKDIILSSTGGSTGIPVKCYLDRRVPNEPLRWRMQRWWGIAPGTDVAHSWRLPRRSIIARMVNRLLWWPTRRIWLDASKMTTDDTITFIKEFNLLRPPLLQGYVGAIHHLAMFVQDRQLPIHSPKAIWVTAAPLPLVQRSVIERVFNAPVYDQYGCCEVPYLAAQCKERDGLHVFSDAKNVEIVDDSGTPCAVGESGNVAITDLDNWACPLIRYVVGDRGHLIGGKSCTCGINLPLMSSVQGRTTDLIRLPNNDVLCGDFMTTIFDDFPDAVRAFQVIQHRDFGITISYVPNMEYEQRAKEIAMVQKRLVEKIGTQVSISFQPVENIQSDRGKIRYIISEL